MASLKCVCRLSSRLQGLFLKTSKSSLSPTTFSLSSSIFHPSAKRISRISRTPVELSCLESMMPLHSATASARLTSFLTTESHTWGVVPQGSAFTLIVISLQC
ncbi:hypothetical protein RJ641_017492 [Dillenia turbinata]|uniref:Uncharacterized protein n=1 Tax=Dillenia turbinata TaxID=194707 RepID=A0AAN8UP55_9MAGN